MLTHREQITVIHTWTTPILGEGDVMCNFFYPGSESQSQLLLIPAQSISNPQWCAATHSPSREVGSGLSWHKHMWILHSKPANALPLHHRTPQYNRVQWSSARRRSLISLFSNPKPVFRQL